MKHKFGKKGGKSMSNEFLVEKYDVYSEKYNVHGEIMDFSFVIELRFQYQDKEIEMALGRPFPDSSEEAFKKLGEETINTYIEKLLSGEIKLQRTMLHYWHIDEAEDRMTGEKCQIAHGTVTGHTRLMDSVYIHTSEVKEVLINTDTKEAEIHTKNSIYYCPLSYCNFKKQDEWAELIPDYENVKRAFENTIEQPKIEPGNVLLVLSNFDDYYFNSLYYIPEEEEEPVAYSAYAHIGTFQDSFLIHDETYEIIDIRYFPHYQNIQFYSEGTDGKPLFVENIGDVVLYIEAVCGIIKLEPGERKEVIKANVEADVKGLPRGDLYPAAMIG